MNIHAEPVYPEGLLMVKDPENPGRFVRDPDRQQQAQRYDEWVWNVKANEELQDLNQRIEQFLATLV